MAGAIRIGTRGSPLAPPAFLPAVAQGALGLECRADDAALRALLAPLDDAATHRAVRAERRALAELEGGCMIPLAAWAREAGGELALDVAAFDLDGRGRLAASAAGPREGPDDLGRRVARDLRALGAERLLRPIGRPWTGPSRWDQAPDVPSREIGGVAMRIGKEGRAMVTRQTLP